MTNTDSQDQRASFVFARRFRDLPDALLAKTVLESASIECLLSDENTIRMDWMWSNLLGGVKLWVREADALETTDLLDMPIPNGFEVTGAGEYKQPECPNCQSLDIAFRELLPLFAYGLYFGVPIPLRRYGWKCRDCGCKWHEQTE
jgi:hypothetical protein